jgi:hypothetical protein
MDDSEPQLAMPSSDFLGDLAGCFPFLGVGCDGCFYVVADVGTEFMVQICVVGVSDV